MNKGIELTVQRYEKAFFAIEREVQLILSERMSLKTREGLRLIEAIARYKYDVTH